ncbi:MAG: hypothetical protein V3U57_06560 [Robiginitomaculum sp.]
MEKNTRELTNMEMKFVTGGSTGASFCLEGKQSSSSGSSTQSAYAAAGGAVAANDKASTDNANKMIDAIRGFFGL